MNCIDRPGEWRQMSSTERNVTSEPLLESRISDTNRAVAAVGSWTAAHASTLERLVEAQAQQTSAARTIAVDVAGIGELDTYGAWLLERLVRTWTDRGQEVRMIGVADRYRGLFEEVQRANRGK